VGRQQQSAPGSWPAGPPQGPGRVRQHPPCELCVRLARRQLPAEGVDHEGRQHHRHPRAHRRVYFGERKEQNVAPEENVAWDTMIYSVEEVQRITRVAAQIALASDPPLSIHSIDKANVLASSRYGGRS
jgi:hypothetical protein